MAQRFINAEAETTVERYNLLLRKTHLSTDESRELFDLQRTLLGALQSVNTAYGFKIKYVDLLKERDENISPKEISTHSAWLGTYEVITKILGEDP